MFKFIDRILKNTIFFKLNSSILEQKKIALFRILVGIITFFRFFQILDSLLIIKFNNYIIVGLIILLITIIFFTIGFLTPLANFILIIFCPIFDRLIGTTTLGTTILVQLLLLFFFLNSGNFFSIDKALSKRKSLIAFFSSLYFFGYSYNKAQITRIYFLCFLFYSICSFQAILLHINDPTWISGNTTKILLTSPYLCNSFDFFQFISTKYPIIFDTISYSAFPFQTFFQLCMIILIFNNYGARFVFYYGMFFFIISLFFINLSYLPHLELILWLIVLKPVKIRTNKVEIFYDDYCSLCKKATKFFKTIDVSKSYSLTALSTNKKIFNKYNLTEKDVRSFMAGTYKNKIYIGYDLYGKLILNNPILLIVYPFFLIGKVTKIGPQIYNYIAHNRYKIFTKCDISYEDEILKKETPILSNKKNKLTNAMYIFMLLFSFFYVFESNSKIDFFEPSNRYYFFKHFGLETPDVFNKADLSMGDKWFEIYKLNNNTRSLVPIVGHKGERLNYEGTDFFLFSNHNSDLLYFGTLSPHKRFMIHFNTKMELDNYHINNNGRGQLMRRIRYDYNKTKMNGKVKYEALLYKKDSVSKNLSFKKTLITSFNLNFDGNKFDIFTKN